VPPAEDIADVLISGVFVLNHGSWVLDQIKLDSAGHVETGMASIEVALDAGPSPFIEAHHALQFEPLFVQISLNSGLLFIYECEIGSPVDADVVGPIAQLFNVDQSSS